MSRLIKYQRQRVKRRVSALKLALLYSTLLSLIIMSVSLYSQGTLSYFNAQYTGEFQITSATKEELVEITESDLIYADKCIAKKPVTVKNIFDYIVRISINGEVYDLDPGEKKYHEEIVADKCNEHGQRNFNIVGYENYFSHPIEVIVDKDMLKGKGNECPQPAIDNANGKENDNGNGKHCGNQGNHVHDSDELDKEQSNTSKVLTEGDENLVKKEEPEEDEKGISADEPKEDEKEVSTEEPEEEEKEVNPEKPEEEKEVNPEETKEEKNEENPDEQIEEESPEEKPEEMNVKVNTEVKYKEIDKEEQIEEIIGEE